MYLLVITTSLHLQFFAIPEAVDALLLVVARSDIPPFPICGAGRVLVRCDEKSVCAMALQCLELLMYC